MKKRLIPVTLAALLLASCFLTGCGGAGSSASGAAASSAPAASSSAQPAAAGALEGFSEQTIAYLKGKDFSSQTLVVGVWGGDYEKIIRENVIPAVESTGASVELMLGGAGDRLAKLYAEKGNPTMDVAYINVHTAAQGFTDGVVEAPDDTLPVFADLYDFAKNPGGYGVAVAPVGIQYNTEVFKEPPTWEDLFKPEYKGKIAFPVFPGTGGDAMLGIVGRMLGKDEHATDEIIEELKKLTPIPLVYTSNDELAEYMQQGLVVAAPNQSSYAQTLNARSENLAFVIPEDPGAILAMDVMSIVSGTKNRDLALAYAQVALDPKVQKAFAEQTYNGITNQKTQLSPEISEIVIDTPDEVAALIELDWPFIIQARKDLAETWNKELIEAK